MHARLTHLVLTLALAAAGALLAWCVLRDSAPSEIQVSQASVPAAASEARHQAPKSRLASPANGSVRIAPVMEWTQSRATAASTEAGFIEVEVLDASGAPVPDVEVRLATCMAPGHWAASSPAARARTDERGRVRLADEEPSRARRIETPSVAATPRVLEARSGERFADPARLVVEPTGAIEVIVLDERGQPPAVPLEIALGFAYENADTDLGSELWCERAVALDGRAVFPRVALARRWVLLAAERGYQGNVRKFDGPSHAGGRTVVSLTARPWGALVRATLLDGSGTRLGDTPVELARASQFGQVGYDSLARATTDARGAVGFSTAVPAPGSATRWIVLASRGSAPAHAVSLAAPEPSTDEHGRPLFECGTLTVREPLTLAAGRVLDPDGRGVAGARVSPFVSSLDGRGAALFWPGEARTQADGSFRIACLDLPAKLSLYVRAAGFAPYAAHGVRPGDDALAISLERASIVRGRAVLPEGIPAVNVHVVLDALDSGEDRELDLALDGSFERLHVAPGRYRALVRLGAEPSFEPEPHEATLLLATEPFDLVAGDVRDLGDLDVGGLLHVFKLRVSDAHGAPLADALVSPTPGSRASPIEQRTGPSGCVRFVSVAATLDARVSAEGFRARELRGLGADTSVALAPGIPVSVRLPRDLPVIAAPFELQVRLAEESPMTDGEIVCFIGPAPITEHLSVSRSGLASGGETWTLHAPRPGSYMLTAWLVDSRTQQVYDLRRAWLGPFEIGDTGKGRPLELELDPDAVARAMSAVR